MTAYVILGALILIGTVVSAIHLRREPGEENDDERGGV